MLNRTNSPNYEISKIDKVFHRLFGYYPSKSGQSYELLVGAVLKILFPDKKVFWDEKIKGNFDNNSYQIDVSLYDIGINSIMVEAKDLTLKSKKATRPYLDKLAGSLIELDFSGGYLFSATSFTRDAKKKAKGSLKNPNTKKLSLFHLRPSDKEDEKNRLQGFIINIHMPEIDVHKTYIQPKLTTKQIKELHLVNERLEIFSQLSFFYENKYLQCYSQLFDKEKKEDIGKYKFGVTLDKNLFDYFTSDNSRYKGTWKVDFGDIVLYGMNFKFSEVEFDIGFKEIIHTMEIKTIGNPLIYVASETNDINKLITDNQLKGISFREDGEIDFDGSKP